MFDQQKGSKKVDKRTEFSNALKESLKTKAVVATATIRLILAALKDRDIEARGHGHPEGINESDILSLLQSMVKQRQESFKTYNDANRKDLADREAEEIIIIKGFLPQQMDESEIKKTVDDLITELGVSDIKEMGKVMAALKTRYAGKLDMARASALVKEQLAA
ncbi:MAG: glutamyl-tRNA amidotransferase [Alphaproteobacteria bacterium CG_4_9_14_3_um_filter_47_13]|nr:MAG: glutamyl-tRNA amidotransferase [Alphaproteobacteria bacterium CG_4_9_14_3_um_filter_47_13]